MSAKLKDIISQDVKSLLKHITGFQESDDNFKTCERYLLSNVIHHRYLSVDSHAIRRSIEGVICKLKIHGLFEKANKLDELVKAFLSSGDYTDHPTVDIQWALLSLLLHLANNPSGATEQQDDDDDSLLPSNISLDTFPSAKEIADWVAYLREGDAEFQANFSDSTLSCSESEEEGDSFFLKTSTVFSEKNERTNSAGSVPSSPVKVQSSMVPNADSKHQRKEMLHKAGEAEKWCRENLQPAWWFEPHPQNQPVSKDPSARLALLWHKCESEFTRNQSGRTPAVITDTLSEHKVVLEVLWMLACPTDTAIFFSVKDSSSISFSVRPHITVPSLTKDVFSDLMTQMCLYFGMIKELQGFCQSVFSCELSRLPANTYYAYAVALRQAQQPLLDQVPELEKQAHQQESSLTLLQVMGLLRPRLKELEVIYNVHKRAVLTWESEPNWLCAIHLMAVLLTSLSESTSATALIYPIVIKSLQGYLNIADLWFATGVLQDRCNEFVIQRSENPSDADGQIGNVLCMRPWEKSLQDRKVAIPLILRAFASKMLSAGRDIEILGRMDRWREIWRITPARGNFSQTLMSCFNEHLKKYELNNDLSKDNLCEEEISISSSARLDSANPRTSSLSVHLRTLHDPFLDVLFTESFHSFEDNSKPASPSELEEHDVSKLPYFFPLHIWLSESLISQLSDRCVQLGGMAANILIKELRLDRHVRFAQSLFFMQAGNILDPFCNILFEQVDRELKLSGGMPSPWESLYTLSVLLEDCVDTEHQDLSSRCSLNQRTTVFKENRSPAVTDTLDTLELGYVVEWPLTLVLSAEKIERYNYLFRLLLKVKWGMWALRQMRFSDIRRHWDHPMIKRIMHLRIWLMHVLNNTYMVLTSQILNPLWESFLEKMGAAKDLESIVQAHDDFLEAAHDQCLRPDKSDVVKNALLQLIVLADKLRFLWKEDPEKMSPSRLNNMEKCYRDCHAFLAALLRSDDTSPKHLTYLCEVFTHVSRIERS